MSDPGNDEPIVIPIGHELDLHSFQPREVASVVEEFVREAAAAGLRQVRIVHGRGRGVQRGMVQAALERHPQVRSFWDDPGAHLGATCAELTPSMPPAPVAPAVDRGQTPGSDPFLAVSAFVHGNHQTPVTKRRSHRPVTSRARSRTRETQHACS